jgi:hypothetical protein
VLRVIAWRRLGASYHLQPVEVRNYVTVNGRPACKLTDQPTAALTVQQLNTSRRYQTAAPRWNAASSPV